MQNLFLSLLVLADGSIFHFQSFSSIKYFELQTAFLQKTKVAKTNIQRKPDFIKRSIDSLYRINKTRQRVVIELPRERGRKRTSIKTEDRFCLFKLNRSVLSTGRCLTLRDELCVSRKYLFVLPPPSAPPSSSRHSLRDLVILQFRRVSSNDLNLDTRCRESFERVRGKFYRTFVLILLLLPLLSSTLVENHNCRTLICVAFN